MTTGPPSAVSCCDSGSSNKQQLFPRCIFSDHEQVEVGWMQEGKCGQNMRHTLFPAMFAGVEEHHDTRHTRTERDLFL